MKMSQWSLLHHLKKKNNVRAIRSTWIQIGLIIMPKEANMRARKNVGFEPYHHGDIPADLPFSALDAGLHQTFM